MKRSFLFHLFGSILLVGLILNLVGIRPIFAQTESTAELTLADLGLSVPRTLTGPVSEVELAFNLPSDWKPEGVVSLDLDLAAFFSSLVATETSANLSGFVGGDLSVYLNDTQVGITTLQQSGQQVLNFQFDAGLFMPVTRDSINRLRIRWDGSISCLMNLLSSITISPSSKLTFGYAVAAQELTLNDFPAPFIVENPVNPVALKIVLPDQPSAGELRAAMILAAGIGQLSKGGVSADVIALANYRPSTDLPQNVFLVINSESLNSSTIPGLDLSTAYGVDAGEGLLQQWKPDGGYGLLISGDETGIIKAAQAFSAGQVIASHDGLSMVVSNVNPVQPESSVEDMTLEDLGVGELVFTRPDELIHAFDFYVPAGNQVRSDATFDLILSHSQQIDYLRSGLQMKVNGYPAVSFRLTDNTANQNLFKLIMPANLVHPGRNTIEFVADLNTRDLCTPPTENVAWIRISSASLLHLPLESAVGGAMLAKKFSDFPNAFLTGSGLDNVVFEISPADFGNIQAAARVAGLLGAGLQDQTLMNPQVMFADMVDSGLIANASLILVGKPTDFPQLSDTSHFPSLVFNPDDTLNEQSSLEVVTRTESGVDAGYLAIRGFDASTSKVLLAVLGNTPTGLGSAVDALSSSRVGEFNFLQVSGSGEQSGWMDAGIASGEVISPSGETPPVNPGVDAVSNFRLGMLKWVVPALAVLLALSLLFLYIEIRQGIRKTK